MFHYIPIHVPLNHNFHVWLWSVAAVAKKKAAFFTLSLAFSRAAASACGFLAVGLGASHDLTIKHWVFYLGKFRVNMIYNKIATTHGISLVVNMPAFIKKLKVASNKMMLLPPPPPPPTATTTRTNCIEK
jgi:hypothetical protein